MRQLGQPDEDVAKAIGFRLSNAAQCIPGVLLNENGWLRSSSRTIRDSLLGLFRPFV
ncbi:MAG: hypothetical protein KAQ74_05145 [Dehalococcoidia bacterium]|nr:hypothetical protein [Dehalococcoidia bacterium]